MAHVQKWKMIEEKEAKNKQTIQYGPFENNDHKETWKTCTLQAQISHLTTCIEEHKRA